MALEPLIVGLPGGGTGWRIADHVWFRNSECEWDCRYETDDLPTDTYTTKEACQQAIDKL